MPKEPAKTHLKILREFQKIDTEFPIQYAICFIEIHLNEGLSVTQLSEKTGMALSTVSRIVGALSKYRQKGTAFELIKIKIPETERRRKELYLTPKGKAIIASLNDLLS